MAQPSMTHLKPVSKRPTAWLVALLILWLGWPLAGQAQQPATATAVVGQVVIEGLHVANATNLIAQLVNQPGTLILARSITKDVRTLFDTGYFADVVAEVEPMGPPQADGALPYRVIFTVIPHPRVQQINVVGQRQLERKSILDALAMPLGSVYTAIHMDRALERVRAAYRAEGYRIVRLHPVIQELDEGNVSIELEITESPRVYLTEIISHGNAFFSQLDIRRVMDSSQVDCFNWINDSGVFDEEKINQDLQRIAAAYLQKGFLRVFIQKPQVTLIHTPAYTKVRVELTIEEGPRYYVGRIELEGDIEGDPERLRDLLTLEPGAPFDPYLQNQDRFALSQAYQEQGYAFVQVAPNSQVDEAEHLVHLTYQIVKGEKAYIGRIEFVGNLTTRDYVIRREFQVRENELFNGRLMAESQQRLMGLGYFAPGSLQIQRSAGEIPNVLDLTLDLEESETNSFQMQMGYSDHGGLSGAFILSLGNLLGKGQTLRVRLLNGQAATLQDYSIDFISPYIFGSNVTSDSSVSFLEQESTGGNYTTIRLAQGLSFPLANRWAYGLTVDASLRQYANGTEPDRDIRQLINTFRYNSVNHPVFSSQGTDFSTSIAQVGGFLGGNTLYRSYTLKWQQFYSLAEDDSLIFMWRMNLGALEGINNQPIPVENRLAIGGINTLRGYQNGEIAGPAGPLEVALVADANGDDPRLVGLTAAQQAEIISGGTLLRTFTAELLMPLAGDYWRAVVFYDAGNINAEARQYQLLGATAPGFFDLKHSLGVGIRIITPAGVFRLEYAAKLTPEPGLPTDRFEFVISSLF